MRNMLLNEIYKLKQKEYSTKNGKNLTLVYIDPKESDDDTFRNKDKFPQYGMVWLPSKLGKYVPHAWGWVLNDGDKDKMIPFINKFAKEVNTFETPKSDGNKREIDEVIDELSQLKQAILNAQSDDIEVQETAQSLLGKVDEFKKKLINGLNSEETKQQLQNLLIYRMEMRKHQGHPLSFCNTILMFMQRPNARDVRSKSEWEQMGYTVKEGKSGIYLLRPSYKMIAYTRAEKDWIIAKFLQDKGVTDVSELTQSQKYDLYHRRLVGKRDMKSAVGFRAYFGYDIKDVEAIDSNAEQFPEMNFDWYDKESEENDKDKLLIKACIAWGESLGLTYEFVDEDALGGARGDASSKGHVRLLNTKQNHGLVSTAIHETAHQVMHWEVVKNKNPRLEKFFRGGSEERGSQVIEQEAELCAWFILGQFGYDMHQNINYMANWGMDETNANNVFDSIAEVAELIYNGINEYGEKITKGEIQ